MLKEKLAQKKQELKELNSVRKTFKFLGKEVMEVAKKEVTDESGQGLIEYALIIGLIAIVVIVVITLLGEKIEAVFQTIINAFAKVLP